MRGTTSGALRGVLGGLAGTTKGLAACLGRHPPEHVRYIAAVGAEVLDGLVLREAGGGTDGGDEAVEGADLEAERGVHAEHVRLAAGAQRGRDDAVPGGMDDAMSDTGSIGP